MTDVDTSAEAVTRWSVVRNNNGLGYFDGIEPDNNGGFVTYDEYHALAAERDALRAAIKRQAGAAKTLRQLTLDEVQHLKDADRTNHIAPSVIQGEREANAILSADNEALRAQLAAAQAQLASDPDRSVYVANHRQAACIHLTAQALGPDYSATIKGLPKAAKHVASLLSEVQAQAQTARNDALREAAKLAWDMEAKYLRKQYVVDHNRKRYDISGVERCENKTANVISEDIHNAILALIYKDTSR